MPTSGPPYARAVLVGDHSRLIAAASRLETLDQVHDQLVPALASALNANFVFAYRGRADERGIRAYLPPSTPDLVADYFAEYAGECPLRRVKDRVQGAVVPTTAVYGHGKLQRTRVYNELWRPWGFDHHVALRFDDPAGGPEVASLGLMINRDHRRGEYADDELSFLRAVVPSLETALRRAARVAVLEEKVDALELLLREREGAGTVNLILDADGQLIHADHAPEAARVLAVLQTPHHPVRVTARKLLRNRDDEPLLLDQRIEVDAQEHWRASLHVRETRLARPLVRVALVRSEPLSLRETWGLSRAEAAVMEQLVAGRSNAEIGQQLFISPETVRTHLTRIYRKMGARSRLEAVLKAGPTGLRGSA